MPTTEELRALGLFDARVPRYTSYPPANHFRPDVGPDTMACWLSGIPSGSAVSLYLHVPYCRRLCWFCACRTQGTSSDRPLGPYVERLERELDIVSRHLPADVTLSHIHLGGGTPTILPPVLIRRLGAALKRFRAWREDIRVSVEIDPTEVDAARIDALAGIGMTRASIGVQDFDPEVQQAIGRAQTFAATRDVVRMLRAAGVDSLNMDLLYGLPGQDRARMAETVHKVLSLEPDRVALYGYAHVPWMAKRQVMIPADRLPDAEARLTLFRTADAMFRADGYEGVGIDHFARPGDGLAVAAREGRLHRNFQGYTDDATPALIGIGASAISRLPQGYAQNASVSSRHAAAIDAGLLATERGHALTADDRLRARMISDLMCDFALDLPAIARDLGRPYPEVDALCAGLRRRFRDHIDEREGLLRLTGPAALIARLAAFELDAYAVPEGRHSRAL
ncbi:oxygen-independent coproporphyrinogen III oxidase [Wenxinia marina]|uniref:Coproporphyrinogen-III oxidase n=1 Tax=Wenxinia marina DSM 24838 TaxID=1123501 RepID=A0A0D0Q932_9RHOB|nr:oxygen-independent coproporphyrinogen III oxidase [Wenxinia marina]KIQ70939.1 oxygen-independent coproporphyrinogen III oxidase [Wenxinia marina DSM 24838]GGL56147.1 coproporphyrinogen-III oxidase [Wenxinia marina]